MFFYLEWIDKRPGEILLVDELPTCKEINYKETFNIDKKEFIICGNINEKFINYYPPCKLHYKKNQYLSSHLQKCIRRMKDIKSVQTANTDAMAAVCRHADLRENLDWPRWIFIIKNY